MVLAAEVLTPVPQYEGLLRLKADVLQQRNRQNFMAYGAALTSSRMGVPRYWLQANEVTLQDERTETEVATFQRSMANDRPTCEPPALITLSISAAHRLVTGQRSPRTYPNLVSTCPQSNSKTIRSSALRSIQSSTLISCWVSMVLKVPT